MSRGYRSAFVGLSLVLSGFAKMSLASALHAPPMKTGRSVFRSQIEEGAERLRRATVSSKALAASAQLREILPEELFDHVPEVVLEECRFSLSDDDDARSQKYLRLALLLKDIARDNNLIRTWRSLLSEQREWARQGYLENSAADSPHKNEWIERFRQADARCKSFETRMALLKDDTNVRAYLVSLAYEKAYQHLGTVAEVPQFKKPDYFISLAELELWAVRAKLASDLDQSELAKSVNMVAHASELLRDAKLALYFMPTRAEIDEAESYLKVLIGEALEELNDDELKSMASDATTAHALTTPREIEDKREEMVYEKYKAADRQLMGTHAKEQRSKVLAHFLELKEKKVASVVQARSRTERVALVARQPLRENYTMLVALGKISDEIQAEIEAGDKLSLVDFQDHYRGLLGMGGMSAGSDAVEFVKATLEATMTKLHTQMAGLYDELERRLRGHSTIAG